MAEQRTRTSAVEEVPLDDLVPDPANPRRMAEAETEALCRSIQELGFHGPILARGSDHRVIDGHQRLHAARRLGLETVPVMFLDVDDPEARLLSLALNKIRGEWDDTLLARLLDELAPHVDLAVTGFSEADQRRLIATLRSQERRHRYEHFDLDAAIEAVGRDTAQAQVGDLWQLADHRLLCGDSTNVADVQRLTAGTTARMAFCDPPYRARLGDHGAQQSEQRKRRLLNDALSDSDWEAFNRAWADHLFAAIDGAAYICGSSAEWAAVFPLLRAAGGHYSTMIVWAKDRFVLGRADYHQQFELIWYGWPDGAKRRWEGGRDQSNLWQIPRPAVNAAHPTQKPLAVVERAIENSSQPGDAVLDLFLGSGTTLIAAERTGRVCFGLELDPHYCDIVIARWSAFTGETAVRLDALDSPANDE